MSILPLSIHRLIYFFHHTADFFLFTKSNYFSLNQLINIEIIIKKQDDKNFSSKNNYWKYKTRNFVVSRRRRFFFCCCSFATLSFVFPRDLCIINEQTFILYWVIRVEKRWRKIPLSCSNCNFALFLCQVMGKLIFVL